MVSAAEEWMAMAQADLAAARHLLQGGHDQAAAFHAHQAAEKALKGLLIAHGRSLPRIHDLVALARELDAPQSILDHCALLSPAYMGTRYPDSAHIVVHEDAEELVDLAEEVVAWCG